MHPKKKRLAFVVAALLTGVCSIVGVLIFQGRLPIRTLSCAGRVDQMRFSPDGHLMAAIVYGKYITIWDAKRWIHLRTLPGAYDTCYFLPDNRSLVTDRALGGPGAEAINRGEGLTRIEWERQKNNIHDHLQRWDAASGKEFFLSVLPLSAFESSAPQANIAVFHKLTEPTGLSIRDTQDGHEIHFLASGSVMSAALSPDGRWLAGLTSASQGGRVTLWNTQTWHKQTALIPIGVTDLQFSPEGRWFSVITAQEISLWRVADWHPMAHFKTHYDTSSFARFTQDSGQIIADGSWNGKGIKPASSDIRIWDIGTEKKIATVHDQDQVFWRVTSRGLMTHDSKNLERNLWDTSSGKLLWQGSFKGWPAEAVSPDGKTLLTSDTLTSNENDGGIIEVRHLP